MRLVQEHIAPGMSNMRPETVNEMRVRVAAERRALCACEYFGDPIPGESADCETCSAAKGKPTRQPLYACEIYGRCTPALPSPKIACCAGCPHNPGRVPKPPAPMKALSAIVESTQSLIQIPQEFRKANAFNPAIVEWQGKLLIAYRDNQNAGSKIWLGELDPRTMQLCGAPRRLKLEHVKSVQGCEDPRFFVWHDKLHLSFAGVQPVNGKTLVHVLFARLNDALEVEQIWEPQYPQRQPTEKNWVQFTWQDELFTVYHPGQNHRVLHHIDGQCRVFAESTSRLTTEAKGGATPVLVGNEFYHFFHTSRKVKEFYEYTMGLYTFAAKPPFQPLRHVPGPVYVPDHRTRPIGFMKSVVFPCGVVLQDGTWLVSAGLHDHECVVLAFDAAKIEKALVKI